MGSTRLLTVGTGDEEGDLAPGNAARVLARTNLELLWTIAEERPASIRETAALVDRDLKNVHGNLLELEDLGVIELEWDGRARRPVVSFDRLRVEVPVEGGDRE